jgi:AcrR family transcriptional regulator
MSKRLHKDHRRAMIIQAGVKLAVRIGLSEVTYDNLARECAVDTSAATVRYHFKNYRALWLAVAKHDRENLWDQAVALGVTDAHK